jgi:hypothetical protein
MKPRYLTLLAVVVLAVACDSSGGGESESPPAKKEAPAADEVKARADEVYGTFRGIYDNLPAPSSKATPCPDDKIREWTSDERELEVTFLAYQSLRSTIGEPWDGTNSLVRFMTNSKLRYQPREKLKLDARHNVKQLMRMWNFVHYIGVVVPSSERQAKATTAHVGVGGALAGQLVIYRKGESAPICSTPFSVHGSGAAQYSHRVGANATDKKNKAEYALKKSLCRDIKKVLTEKIGSLSKVLKASYLDCNSV